MGRLYLISTPIGNRSDISPRARETLDVVDVVLAEDTRVSKRFLSSLEISTPVRAYHDFNKERITEGIISELVNGRSFALITDAGTPGIADPAFYLVREAVGQGITVVPIPGPSAVHAALICSGLPCDRYIFENFLPPKSGGRKKRLASFIGDHRTIVFFESPHRILKVLRDMNEVLGDVPVVIGREMTKVHEEFMRGTPQQLMQQFQSRPPKGEMTVVVNCRNVKTQPEA